MPSLQRVSQRHRKKQRLRDLLQGLGAISQPISTIAEFVRDVGDTSKKWQDRDIKKRELDEESFLNDARIVGRHGFAVKEAVASV